MQPVPCHDPAPPARPNPEMLPPKPTQSSRVGDGKLVGRWRLRSWTAKTDLGAISYPLGERPVGSLVYTRGGWMTVTIAAGDRPNLATGDVVGGTQEERAAAFSTYFAYCGEYAIDGDIVVHRIGMSMFPNWVGIDQKRHFELSDGGLVLRSQPFEMNGEAVVNELRWVREE